MEKSGGKATGETDGTNRVAFRTSKTHEEAVSAPEFVADVVVDVALGEESTEKRGNEATRRARRRETSS